MKKSLLILILFITNLFGLGVSSDDKYKLITNKNYTIIYTDDHIQEALFIKNNIDEFIAQNDKSYGHSFDEPIKIVLISNNIQIINAFSTQIPFNQAVFYNGGGGSSDYFANNSWLVTLFTHEMVHNYQVNAKKSQISKTLKKYLGNNASPLFASVVPFFTLPNIFLPIAFLEGNAVLNESLYSNGGRLFHGGFNALKNSLVFENKITPKTFINNTLDFPYTQQKYIVGAYYMQYLANKHGLDTVNRFFYENSIHAINPLLLNSSFKKQFKTSFERSVQDFVVHTKKKYAKYKQLPLDNKIATSKSQIYLSKVKNKVFFITSDLKTKKELHTYDMKKNIFTHDDTSLQNGKVFILDDKLYSNGSGYISSHKYKQGLFDEDNYILKPTQGKNINDIHNNKYAYIKIKESFLSPKLYIDDEFYENVSSSSMFDEVGSIYYFKQDKDTRILYQNKKELFRFQGYFSKVVDIIKDGVYFIANTQSGSTLYMFKENEIFQLSKSDNIVDAKILNNTDALLVSVTDDNYTVSKSILDYDNKSNVYYQKNDLSLNEFSFKYDTKNVPIKSKKYNELKELEFSSLYPTYSSSSSGESTYLIKGLFMDPVMFNMLNVYAYKDEDDKITGINYINERYIPFKINLYHSNSDNKTSYSRNYGGSIGLYGAFLKKGNHQVSANLTQYIDDDNKNKNPLVLSLKHQYMKSYRLATYANFSNQIEILMKNDRGDFIFGFDYMLNKHIVSELYFDAQIKSLTSNTEILKDQRGIKVVNDTLDKDDNTNVYIEGIDNNGYVKEITKTVLGVSKVFNISSYFSKFPVSLQKESLFYNYAKYDIVSASSFEIKEKTVGLGLDLLFFHKFSVPLTFKYIENDFSKNDSMSKVEFGFGF